MTGLPFGNVTHVKVHRVDGGAVDVLAIFWIGDPAGLRGVEGGVSPRLDMEHEPTRVDVTGSHVEAPVLVLVEVDVVQEDDNFGRGDKPALKVDAHGGRVLGCPHVFAGEKVEIGGRGAHDVVDGVVEPSVAPGNKVAIRPRVGEVRECRLDTNVGVFVDIKDSDAVGETGKGDEATRETDSGPRVRLRVGCGSDGLSGEFAEEGHGLGGGWALGRI